MMGMMGMMGGQSCSLIKYIGWAKCGADNISIKPGTIRTLKLSWEDEKIVKVLTGVSQGYYLPVISADQIGALWGQGS